MEKGHTLTIPPHGFVRYVDHLGSDQRIVEAARVSYGSPSKGPEADKKLLGYLLRNRHTSPFEQPNITFNIKMPIFKQGSTRSELQHGLLTHICEATYMAAYGAYKQLLGLGVAKEMARIVLPLGVYTEIYVNCDLHNLMHFLRLRFDPHAQLEMQDVAFAMKRIAQELFPWTFEFFDKYKLKLEEACDAKKK